MVLKDTHEKLEEIPEQYRELYTEKNGKWEFTGVQGIRTSADVERVQEALRKEKNDHKAAKEALAVWGDLKHDEVIAKLDKFPELEAASKGKLDEAQIEEIVQRRVEGTLKSKLAPVERQNKQLSQQLAEALEKATTLEGEKKKRTLHDSVRKAVREAKVLPEAEEDVLLLAERVMEIAEDGKVVTKDGVGVTPGLEPQAWLSEIQDRRPHWWPGTQGGNAPGSGPRSGPGGPNPWSHDGWNMTQQGAFLRQHGADRANQMAKAAGTTVGGPRPTPKKSPAWSALWRGRGGGSGLDSRSRAALASGRWLARGGGAAPRHRRRGLDAGWPATASRPAQWPRHGARTRWFL